MVKSFGSAMIGAIAGVIATAVVGAGVAYFTDLRSAATNWAIMQATNSIVDHLQLRLRAKDVAANYDDWGVLAECLKGEIAIGGVCSIHRGEVLAQGLSERGYWCRFKVEEPLKNFVGNGTIQAYCLGTKSTPQSN